LCLVTEDEIDHGIFKSQNPNAVSLCYTRTLSKLPESLTDKDALRYIDTVSSKELDCEAQKMLHNLKWEKLPKILEISNIHHYEIDWLPGGINENSIGHAQYLSQLCGQVYGDVKRLIDEAKRITKNCSSGIWTEVLHHAQFCNSKSVSYCDRKDAIMGSIKNYVQSSSSTVPLIIHGKSGSGKTSIMGKTATLLPFWVGKEVNGIIRFLGTSPMSSTLRGLLVSIIEHLSYLFGSSVPAFNKMDTVHLIQLFCTEIVPSLNGIKSKIVLLLDSVDQLAATDSAHSMKWLPKELPSNVKIVVSILEEKHNCLENVRSFLTSNNSYVAVGLLQVETGQDIINFWLSKVGRTLTEAQNKIILDAFLACPQPLFLRLLFGHARTWKSYTIISSENIPTSTSAALSHFYNSLEVQFGRVLVQRALGYLTAAKHGLTEAELEDVLSLDNEVLNDVYQYWDPPFQGIIRIPTILWKRIRYFIEDYIVEQQADRMTVLKWYHRQFIESATERYVVHQNFALHSILSEYFSNTYANGKRKMINLTYRNISSTNTDRQIASQPLLFGDKKYNFRKIAEFPHHLLHSKQIANLKHSVLCNFEWVYTKLKAVGYILLMQDYVASLGEIKNDEEISLMCEVLSLSGSNIRNNPDMLAGQLIARLLPFTQTALQKVRSDSDNWISKTSQWVFKPMNNCLVSPGQELLSTLSAHPSVVLAVQKVRSSPLLLLISYSKGPNQKDDIFHVWDVSTLECIENVNTFIMLGFGTQPSKFVVTADHLVSVNTSASYAVWNLRSGVCSHYTLESDETTSLTCIAALSDESNLLLGSKSGTLFIAMLHSSKEVRSVDIKVEIKDIFVSHDDSYALVLAGNDKLLTIDVKSSEVVTTITINHTKFASKNMLLIGDWSLFVTGTQDGRLMVISLPLLQVKTMEGHAKVINCIAYVPLLNSLVTGSADKSLHVWNAGSFELSKTLKGHLDSVWCISSISETTLVISGSKDDYLKVWDVSSGECLNTLEGHSSWISCVTAISMNIMISGSNDKKLKVWNIKRKQEISNDSMNERHSSHPEDVIFLSSSLAVSCGPDVTKVWNPCNGKCLQTIDFPASCLTFLTNNEIVISGNGKGWLQFYTVSGDSSLISLSTIKSAHSAKITTLLLLQVSELAFVSASLDGVLKVWNSCFNEHSILVGHASGVLCAAIFGETLASGSQDADIRIWNVLTSTCVGVLKGHTKNVLCLTFSTEYKRLISGSDDFSVRVWNIDQFHCLKVIWYADSIKCLQYINSLGIIIAGAHSGKNQLKSWGVSSGSQVEVFVGHTHAVMCMLRIDEDHILTGSRDGTLRTWNVHTAKMISVFDLQSQIKHIAVTKMTKRMYLYAATTKTGTVSFFQFIMKD